MENKTEVGLLRQARHEGASEYSRRRSSSGPFKHRGRRARRSAWTPSRCSSVLSSFLLRRLCFPYGILRGERKERGKIAGIPFPSLSLSLLHSAIPSTAARACHTSLSRVNAGWTHHRPLSIIENILHKRTRGLLHTATLSMKLEYPRFTPCVPPS